MILHHTLVISPLPISNMNMTDLFNSTASRSARDAGMEQAAFSFDAQNWLTEVRAVARMLIAKNGEVTIDDVLRICPRPPWISPNATGSVFKGGEFVACGYTQTAKVSSHARAVRIWRLKD